MQKYLQDFRRPAYNAVLKWKPKSKLSRVSNSAQTQYTADTPKYNYITNSKNIIHILNNSIYYMNIFKILPSFKICNGFVMRLIWSWSSTSAMTTLHGLVHARNGPLQQVLLAAIFHQSWTSSILKLLTQNLFQSQVMTNQWQGCHPGPCLFVKDLGPK